MKYTNASFRFFSILFFRHPRLTFILLQKLLLKKKAMDSLIEVIEIKDEVIESVDVPIQDGTKSAIDIIVKKELMDSSEVEVVQGQSTQTFYF